MVKKIIGLGLVLCMLLTCAIMPASADAAELSLVSVLKTVANDQAPNRPHGMCKTDKYAFVSYPSRIEVIDVQNPNAPSHVTDIICADYKISSYTSVENCYAAIKGDYLIVLFKRSGGNYTRIHVYNVSQIAQDAKLMPVAQLIGSPQVIYTSTASLTIDGDTAYVLSETGGLFKFDVSIATLQAAEAATKAAIEAATDITKVTATSLTPINVCDKATAFGTLANYSYNDTAYNLAIANGFNGMHKSGDYLYYTVNSKWGLFLGMLKVTDSGCEMVGYYPLIDYQGTAHSQIPACCGIVTKGTKVYVLPRSYAYSNILNPDIPNNKKNALLVLDAATAMESGTAAAPVKLTLDDYDVIGGTTDTNSAITALALNGDQLYVWGSGASVRGIYMYDLTSADLTRTKVYNPTGVEGFVNSGESHGNLQRNIYIDGDMMYSLDGYSGLVIHRMPANEVTAPVVNNGTIDLDVLEDGNLKAKTTITNYSSDDYSGLIIIAHYENVGGLDKLVDLKATPFSVPAGKIGYVVESEALAVSAGTSVKAMVWSNWTGIAPIVAPTTIAAE